MTLEGMPERKRVARNLHDLEFTIVRRWFECWRTLDDFRLKFDTVYDCLTPDRQFGNNETKWINEAWILTRVAHIIRPSELRISEKDPPDAHIRLLGKEFPIEVTVADKSGRRISLEYQNRSSPHAHYDLDEKEPIVALRKAICSKSLKKYPKNTFLFVYLNCGFSFGQNNQTNDEIRKVIVTASEKFKAICVLWGDRVYGPEWMIDGGCKLLAYEDLEAG